MVGEKLNSSKDVEHRLFLSEILPLSFIIFIVPIWENGNPRPFPIVIYLRTLEPQISYQGQESYGLMCLSQVANYHLRNHHQQKIC